jgi:hypothetical protein
LEEVCAWATDSETMLNKVSVNTKCFIVIDSFTVTTFSYVWLWVWFQIH